MSTSSKKRATFHSRLGFILVSAGCAVGLGNVWKFPSAAKTAAEHFCSSTCCVCFCWDCPLSSANLPLDGAAAAAFHRH